MITFPLLLFKKLSEFGPNGNCSHRYHISSISSCLHICMISLSKERSQIFISYPVQDQPIDLLFCCLFYLARALLTSAGPRIVVSKEEDEEKEEKKKGKKKRFQATRNELLIKIIVHIPRLLEKLVPQILFGETLTSRSAFK